MTVLIVDGFEEAVGLTGLRPGHEACNFLHRLDLGSPHAHTPVLERIAHDVDLLSPGCSQPWTRFMGTTQGHAAATMRACVSTTNRSKIPSA